MKETADENTRKFKHLSECSWLTRFLLLITSIDSNEMFHACINGSHVVHVHSQSHLGLSLTIGKGAMMNALKKLGLSTISLTENEVVSDRERHPKCTWFCCFCLAQGDEAREDLLIEDNKSCMLLYEYYLFSVRKSSKYAKIRCFFIVNEI